MLETSRLILRRWLSQDLDPIARLNSSPQVMRHFPKTLTREESAAFIGRLEEGFEHDGFGFFAVVRKDTQETIGACGLYTITWQAHFTPAVEVGWRFLSEHWGQGFATEAAKASLEYGWSKGLSEIVALAVPANLPSHRVMERIGMKRDLKGDFLHPRLDPGHPLQPHWLWRIRKPSSVAAATDFHS